MNYLTRSLAFLTALTFAALAGHAQSCTDPEACNYDPNGGTPSAVCLEVEAFATHTDGDLAGMTTWRVYFHTTHPDDFVTAVYGNSNEPLALTTTTNFYQDALGGATAQPINPLLLPSFPNLEFDSYITIGLSQMADGSAGENAPSTAASPNQNWTAAFEAGEDLIIDDLVGGLWFIYNVDANGAPDADGRVLLAQLTTDGDIGGTLNVQYFPAGGVATTATLSLDNPCDFGSTDDCTYPEANLDCDGNCLNDVDADQICDEVDDCIGSYDALGVCNGNCAADADADGICDDVDDCVGALDACGVCNGPGAVEECGCSGITAGDCDCDGNQLDALGVCGGSCTADADADGICDDVDDCVGTPDAIGVCNGDCSADADADGICDDVDDCIGQLDECGICNGPGATGDCGCDDIPAGDCDCNGNQFDAIGDCGGSCTADADGDGICDDVDDCVGDLDVCGVCNGPGAIYDCGCSDIPDGDCDCNGNQVDALGVCGGDCPADADGNGICDIYEGSGCADETACNFDPFAEPVDDETVTDYCLLTEVVATHTSGDLAGMTTYRVSIQTLHETDFVTSVSGNSVNPTYIQTTSSFYQHVLGGATPANINPLLLPAFPNLTYDSWITIGLDGPADVAAGESDASVVQSPGQSWSVVFDPGSGTPGADIAIDDLVGGVWYILNGDANGVPDADGRVLLGQFTTDGELSGNMQVQVFPQGDNENFLLLDLPLGLGVGCPTGSSDNCLYDDALGTCGGDCAADADGDGICDDIDDCVGDLDECGVCNGPGAVYDCGCEAIPDGDCDCDGNQADALGVCGGSCTADADADGICDDVDDCIGLVDECGICNGPGATGDCGCDDIPDGACDCNGNVLDAIGVCGGDCAADADGDGICDDVDDCIGELDACGVCNGPGAIYDCGCEDIPDGDCDCDGNQADAIGVCGGDCTADVNGNGLCDDVEPQTCDDPEACNYDPNALPFVPTPADDGYCVELRVIEDHTSGDLAGMTTYQILLHTENETDFVTSVYGNENDPLAISTTTHFYQHVLGGPTPESVNPLLLPVYPNLAYDSWITIGLDGPADASAGESAAATVQSPGQPWVTAFDPGAGALGGNIVMDDAVGGVWYVLNGDANGTPVADGTVLLGQFTTDGEMSGTVNIQVFPQGDNIDYLTLSLPIGGNCVAETVNPTCTYPESDLVDCDGNCLDDADGDGVCDADEVPGCTDETACNYNPEATDEDGTCADLDECGVCNGPGAVYDCGCEAIPDGDCDCDGNQADALGVCGGSCTADADADGICDDVDDCIGLVDECGICNGPGATGDCGCDDIPDGACDCNGNVLDAIGVCGGDCAADADGDGICDDVDDCIGELDACGVCNGPGAIYDCGCEDIPDGDCDCDGNQADAIGVCGGDCTADVNGNGLCDDVEPQTCDDPEACNYDPNALPFVPTPADDGYCVELRVIEDHTSGDLAGMTTYQILLHTENETDFVTSVYGNENDPLAISTTTHFYQHVLGGPTPESVNPLLLPVYPNLAYDSWITIGLDGPADASAGESAAATVQSPGQPWVTAFDPGAGALGGNIVMDDAVGGVWYVLNGDANGTPVADGTVLLGQFTTDGEMSGTVNIQVFPQGDNIDYLTLSLPIGGNCVAETVNPTCTYPESDLVDCDGNCLDDADGDGVCDADEVPGCTDETACNYNPEATDEDGTCAEVDECGVCGGGGIPDGDCDCDGNQLDALGVCGGTCPADLDGDGVCDTDAILGCTYPEACNYEPEADVNDGSCDFLSCAGCTDAEALNYDADATVEDGSCLYGGCTDPDAANYDATADLDDGSCEFPGCTNPNACNYDMEANVDDGSCDTESCAGCTIESACNFDPDATLLDVDSCDFFSCRGCTDPEANNYDPDATQDDGSCIYLGCTDPDAPNFDEDATFDDGSCLVGGCKNPLACNFDYYADYNDGSCEFDSCSGCMILFACNYDPEATLQANSTCDFFGCCGDPDADNYTPGASPLAVFGCEYGTAGQPASATGCDLIIACNYGDLTEPCEFDSCAGCTDPEACNYNPDATLPTTCLTPEDTYGVDFVDCDGNCLSDSDGDGLCDTLEVNGCTDILACNFDPLATQDDGSCETSSCGGCMDTIACNYDVNALLSDGSCDYLGCIGCLDPEACNYDEEATVSDNSCTFPINLLRDCSGDCIHDTDGDGICDEQEVEGCTDLEACNFQSLATEDNGSCDYLSCKGCTVPEACNFDPLATDSDGSCEFSSCLGCTYPDALNYDPNATQESGICLFDAPPANTCPGDFTDDGIISIADLLDFLAVFESTCN